MKNILKKLLALSVVLSSLELLGCATPQQLLKPIEIAADDCGVEVGKVFSEIKTCLDAKKIILEKVTFPNELENWKYISSNPTYILVTFSVASIRIGVGKDGIIKEWKMESHIDG